MREAIGSGWVMTIVLAFIALFSGYLAFSINYSKAFRMKDEMIEIIEKHNGPTSEALGEINKMMNEINYSAQGACEEYVNDSEGSKTIGVLKTIVTSSESFSFSDSYNYCLTEVAYFGGYGQLSSSYYKVHVFFSLSLPMINNSSIFNIAGETKSIYYPENECMKGCTITE